jgi:hypothetical protein
MWFIHIESHANRSVSNAPFAWNNADSIAMALGFTRDDWQ